MIIYAFDKLGKGTHSRVEYSLLVAFEELMAYLRYKGRRQNSYPLAAGKMLQHSTAMYSFSYVNWLQLAA